MFSEYLKMDPFQWNNNLALQIIHSLQTVNYITERGIKLVEDLNERCTKSENQKHSLYHVSYKKLCLHIILYNLFYFMYLILGYRNLSQKYKNSFKCTIKR